MSPALANAPRRCANHGVDGGMDPTAAAGPVVSFCPPPTLVTVLPLPCAPPGEGSPTPLGSAVSFSAAPQHAPQLYPLEGNLLPGPPEMPALIQSLSPDTETDPLGQQHSAQPGHSLGGLPELLPSCIIYLVRKEFALLLSPLKMLPCVFSTPEEAEGQRDHVTCSGPQPAG